MLGDVDLVAAEHGVDAVAQAGTAGERDEQADGLVGDAVLGVVQIDAVDLEREPFPTIAGSAANRSRRWTSRNSSKCASSARHSGDSVIGAMPRNSTGIAEWGSEAAFLEEAQPDLAQGRERRDRVPQRVERHLAGDRDGGRVRRTLERDLRLDRSVLQPHPPAFRAWNAVTGRV